MSMPGMAESIIAGNNEPIDECLEDSEVWGCIMSSIPDKQPKTLKS